MDEFFWTDDYWVRVNSIWKLAQEPYQVSFYVPKRKSPDTTSSELVTVDESLLPADWHESDEGWGSDAEEDQNYEDAIEYRIGLAVYLRFTKTHRDSAKRTA